MSIIYTWVITAEAEDTNMMNIQVHNENGVAVHVADDLYHNENAKKSDHLNNSREGATHEAGRAVIFVVITATSPSMALVPLRPTVI